jgi:hypothetical protein
MVGPCFITSDIVIQASPSSQYWLKRRLQLSKQFAFAVPWVVSESILHKLYGCEVFMDDIIGRTVTNLWLVCQFISSRPSVVKNQCSNVKSLMWMGTLNIFIGETFSATFKHVNPLICAFLWQNTVCNEFPYLWHLQPTKRDHCKLVSLVHVVSGAAVVTTLVVQDNWMIKVIYITTTTVSLHACGCMQFSCGAMSWTKINTLWILLDLPL